MKLRIYRREKVKVIYTVGQKITVPADDILGTEAFDTVILEIDVTRKLLLVTHPEGDFQGYVGFDLIARQEQP
jgi:hypothetical protein